MLQTCKIKLRGVDDIDKYVPKRITKKKWKATEEAKNIQSLTTTFSGKVSSIIGQPQRCEQQCKRRQTSGSELRRKEIRVKITEFHQPKSHKILKADEEKLKKLPWTERTAKSPSKCDRLSSFYFQSNCEVLPFGWREGGSAQPQTRSGVFIRRVRGSVGPIKVAADSS